MQRLAACSSSGSARRLSCWLRNSSRRWRRSVRRQRTDRLQQGNVGRGWTTDADDTHATIRLDGVLDADRYVDDASGVKRQRNVVGVVVDRAFAFEDEDRILRQRMYVGNVGLARFEADIVQVRFPGADAGPDHESRILRNQRQPQRGVITVEQTNSHRRSGLRGSKAGIQAVVRRARPADHLDALSTGLDAIDVACIDMDHAALGKIEARPGNGIDDGASAFDHVVDAVRQMLEPDGPGILLQRDKLKTTKRGAVMR